MIRRRLLCLITAVAAWALPFETQALEGFYGSIGIGGARIESDLSQLGLLPDTLPPLPGDLDPPLGNDDLETLDVEGNEVAWRTFIGYRIWDFLAVEAGYVNLGEAQDFACFENPTGGCFDAGWTTQVEVTGWQASVLGILPVVENLDVFAKLGVLAWDADTDAQSRGGNLQPNPEFPPIFTVGTPPLVENLPNGIVSRNTDGTDLTLGFGADIKASDEFTVRSEFEWYDLDDTDSVWAINLSFIWDF